MSSHPFGLNENPFLAGHDPRLIFQYEKRIEAVTLLRHRIAEGASFVTVTGNSGCGKTSVVAEALESDDVAGFTTKVAIIDHPSLTPSELLEAVCIEFGAPLPNPPSKPQTLASLEKHLRDLRRQGMVAVLVLDEAHGLKTELLEETRLLSNMKHEGRGLLQTVLVGLPELERRLGLPELAQLRQRIAAHCRMTSLRPEETAGYVRHRVTAAGGDGAALFPEETCEEIHGYTNGFPRDINTLAAGALEHAERDGATEVTVDHVRMAAGDSRPGITTVQRSATPAQSFELKRKTSVARSFEPAHPVEPAPAPAPPPRPEPKKPPSFLRVQHAARTGTSGVAPESPATEEKPTLEHRFRNGEVTEQDLAAERPRARSAGLDATDSLWGSEHVRELGASVLLVGVLVVVLLMTGRWNPVPRASAPPAPSAPEPSARMATVLQPTTPAPPPPETVPAPAVPEPTAPAPGSRTANTILSLEPGEPVPVIDSAERWGNGMKQGYGFEVLSTAIPDSAIQVLRKITRGPKLPCRIVTKSTGDPYRVVVGPFPTRRDAQQALTTLFKTPIVKRAQLVQIPQ